MKQLNPQTIVAFLKSRGWKLVGSSSQFYTLKAPKDLQLASDFEYRIPANQQAKDFQEYAMRQVMSIAELYQMNKWVLLDLMAQSLDQIKEDVKLKQSLIANAS